MKDIPAARQEIERIDSEIIRLLAARQECARIIGENKRLAGTNVFVPEREEELLRKLEKLAESLKIPSANVRAIYREIISASVALQMQDLPVAYLGPEGTFTHQAARKNFGGSVNLIPMRTIGEIFEAVERGKAGYGVIPIENSNAGAVTGALDTLAESVPDAGGAYFVSAFTGLGAPHWDMYARGALVGVTRATNRAHIARAVLEGIAYQVGDLARTMV